jgi:hypothetical protein
MYTTNCPSFIKWRDKRVRARQQVAYEHKLAEYDQAAAEQEEWKRRRSRKEKGASFDVSEEGAPSPLPPMPALPPYPIKPSPPRAREAKVLAAAATNAAADLIMNKVVVQREDEGGTVFLPIA